jgi:hypothetical protein
MGTNELLFGAAQGAGEIFEDPKRAWVGLNEKDWQGFSARHHITQR